MTNSQRMRESAVMISSTIPSAKYSCSGSPLIFWNGNTAIGQGECWSAFERRHFGRVLRGGEPHSVDPHRTSNVLEALLSNVVEREVETPRYVLLNARRNANASGLGQTFQTSRYVHPITEDVAVFYDDIALMNAYSEFDAFFYGDLSIALDHGVLDLN